MLSKGRDPDTAESPVFESVLRFCDILVRIRTLGSLSLSNESESGSGSVRPKT
jgi:hypothetical protein